MFYFFLLYIYVSRAFLLFQKFIYTRTWSGIKSTKRYRRHALYQRLTRHAHFHLIVYTIVVRADINSMYNNMLRNNLKTTSKFISIIIFHTYIVHHFYFTLDRCSNILSFVKQSHPDIYKNKK